MTFPNQERITAEKLANQRRDEAAFQEFLARPEVKLTLSMVPPAQPPELINTLLRMTFDAGQGHGVAIFGMMMLEAMLKPGKREG